MAETSGRQEDPRLIEIIRADRVPWYRKPNLRFLYFVLVPACIGTEWTNGFDGAMMNNLQNVPAWIEHFNNPTGATLGLLNAIQSLGTIMAVPFAPFVTKRFGRRWSIVVGSIINILGAAIQSGSSNTSMFLASRWLVGFGLLFCVVNGASLIGELSYARERAFLTSLFNANWFLGTIIASSTTYGTYQINSNWAWRIPSMLQLVFSFIQLAFIFFLPESPRWLISNDRYDEALAVLQKYHSEGDEGEEYVRLEYAEIQSTIQIEKEIAKKFLWADVFRDAAMRRRFLVAGLEGLFTQTSGNSLLTNYMSSVLKTVGITDHRTMQQIILSYNCWGLLNAVPIALIAPRYPRRRMFLLCTSGMAIAYMAWTILSARFAATGSHSIAIASIAFIYLYSPFSNVGFNALGYTYVVELFPFSQRSQGVAFEQLVAKLGLFLTTYTNPIALDALKWKYYIVYCVWIACECALIYLLFPETHNRTLEEISFLLEGEEVNQKAQVKMAKILNAEKREVDSSLHVDVKDLAQLESR